MIEFNKIKEKELLSTPETKELLAQAQQGDKIAKDKLVCHNLRLVLKIAHRFKTEQYQIDEIFQVGTIGLMKAIENFDLSRKVEFSTYAVPVIIGKIRSYLRDDEQIKIGRTLKQRAKQIKKMQEQLNKEFKREATIQELSSALNLSSQQIVSALEAAQTPSSIYDKVYQQGDDSLKLIDQLMSEDDIYEKEINRLTLSQILKDLTPRAKRIIKLRYFDDKSQSEIADLIGVSQAQVSRLEKKILNNIRDKLKGNQSGIKN
ncbi:SigB/SigF/SigG family RNA polymerase sigma factor [Halanaerobacter jeridensis]|uniref:RNA polymerase sigma factor n=1 Tax=Halanaerobacter jeridensis TaxID=706427 RepID=A0A938XS53_9FIRM|nr:SigB/SigF/SigG family RNA polymerase sigma factor [Halanaerobacter jeridensis]MBM7555266.1 RNA polymerase sporulation-specific sigma factor [Halanaerobacter jeridensis]